MNYKDQQEIKNKERLQQIVSELPEYAANFFNYYLAIKEASSRTVLNYAYDMRIFFRYIAKYKNCDIKDVSLDILNDLKPLEIQNFITELNKTNSTAGKSRRLASLRSFYKYMRNIGYIKNNPALLVETPNTHEKNIIHLENDEVKEVLTGIKTGDSLTDIQKKYAKNSKYRDYAITTLLLGTGIRVSECVGIDLSDINWQDNSIKIYRKGGDEQLVYFTEQVRDALEDYIDFEREEPLDEPDALFSSRKHQRISVRAVERIINKYTKTAVPNKHITPHKLRSTYGTNLYQESGDIYLTADALGHKNIAVTAEHYADMGNKRRKTAADYTNKWLNNK